MEPDLACVNAVDLEFTAQVLLGRAQIKEIFKQEKIGRTAPLFYANSYTIGGNSHSASAFAYRRYRKPDELVIRVTYSTESSLRFDHPEAKPVAHLMGLLEGESLTDDLRCFATFQYSGREWESALVLPLKLLNVPSMPFDEIRGFRAVKFTDDGRVKYSVVLDRPQSKDYTQLVSFSLASTLTTSLVDLLLSEATEISSRLIRRIEVKGDKRR